MKLIKQIVPGYEKDPSLEEMDNRSLQRMLRQHLQDKSYFIVLDNILKEMELKSILKALPSRGEENKFTKELEKKGKEMLKKCWGLPMAITDVARQKAKQRLLGIEWEKLFDSIDLSEPLKLLEPMYHQLEELIKPQFLHLSLFKENAIMREEKMEQIWAANGLDIERVPERLGLAANQFDIEKVTWVLAGESILEVVKHNFGKRKYRLNPLLHMISRTKAEEEIGFEILRSNGNSRPSQNARHRVIHYGRDKFNPFTNENSKQLISLVFHGGGGYLEDNSLSYWESCELLKILDMEDFGVKTLSETIGALIELRYLGLRNNYIQEIPHSLADLKKLEFLDIALNFMVEVSNIIWQMGNLRNLHMSNVICRKPLKVDAMRNLETLTYISIYDWTYKVSRLKTMHKFQKLGVEEVDENSDVGQLFASLAMVPNFDNLVLRGFRFRSMPCLDEIGVIIGLTVLKLDGRIGRLPSADNLPQMITCITLVNTCLDEDPMPILEKLSWLFNLKLQNAYTGQEMVIQQGGFPVLEVLCINELWNLRKIQIDDDAMSSVMELEINNCPHLKTLPTCIRRMSKLQKFKMVTTKHIATKIRNSGLTTNILEEDIHP
ncbi:probable disease resistance protein At1g58602 isoform X2 [Salvia hispanica]|uniref:probable disease resistance protein At1g58602 isoform X2 n=1 Tax=Salvia hispanica TaxID=49212 RepID=UPI00200973B1|nr:probable disease resistance protein At1g58602 isoform X2 [Salvia hispanica]